MIYHACYAVANVCIAKKLLPKNTPKDTVKLFLTPETKSCNLFGSLTFRFDILVDLICHLSHYGDQLVLVVIKVDRGDQTWILRLIDSQKWLLKRKEIL